LHKCALMQAAANSHICLLLFKGLEGNMQLPLYMLIRFYFSQWVLITESCYRNYSSANLLPRISQNYILDRNRHLYNC